MVKRKESMSVEDRLAAALVPEEEWPYEIPENWLWTKIGSLTDVIGGGTPSTSVPEYYNEGTIPWLSPADLSDYEDIYISQGAKNITTLGLEKSSARLLPMGTVCLSSRAPIGYVVITQNPLSTNQGFKSFPPSPSFLPEYLYWYLKGNKPLLESRASGTTFLELSGRKAAEIELPLPPLPEQHRIVNQIESSFAKLDEIAEEAQAVIDGYENRKAAILHRAFTGELTEEWRLKSHISDECWHTQLFSSIIVSGPQNGLYKSKDSYGQGYRILRVDGFYDGWIEPWDTLKRLSLTQEELKLYQLNIGDIIVNRVNSMPYLGKSALIRELPEPCVFESNMMRIVINIDQAVPEYITRYLNSPLGLSELRKNAKQAINQASINQKDVGNVLIPLPPLPEQHEIVRRLDTILAAEAATKVAAEATLENITTLRQSILARAFRGELGTNDPNDEPAIELLKRTLLAN